MTGEYQAVYTHGHHESVLRGHRVRTAENSAGYLLPHLQPGMSVLDVGCGPGTITVDLASRIAPGQVTAVELTDDALDLARAEAQQRGQSNIEFVDVGRPRAGLSRRHLRRRARASSAPARRRPGAGAARDAASVQAGRCRAPAVTPTTRDSPGSHSFRHWTAGWRCTPRPRGPTGVSPTRAGGCCRGPSAPGSTDVTPSGGLWCFATPETRDWWGGMWSDRIVESALARQLVDSGMATPAELDEIASAWRQWAAAPDGWLGIPHGEILGRA